MKEILFEKNEIEEKLIEIKEEFIEAIVDKQKEIIELKDEIFHKENIPNENVIDKDTNIQLYIEKIQSLNVYK